VGADGRPHQPQRRCRGDVALIGFKNSPPEETRLTRELQRGNFRRLLHPVTGRTTPTFFLWPRSRPICHQDKSSFDPLAPIPARTATFTSVSIPCMLRRKPRRGQVYPTGEKSKQTPSTNASVAGTVSAITPGALPGRFGCGKSLPPMATKASVQPTVQLWPPPCGAPLAMSWRPDARSQRSSVGGFFGQLDC